MWKEMVVWGILDLDINIIRMVKCQHHNHPFKLSCPLSVDQTVGDLDHQKNQIFHHQIFQSWRYSSNINHETRHDHQISIYIVHFFISVGPMGFLGGDILRHHSMSFNRYLKYDMTGWDLDLVNINLPPAQPSPDAMQWTTNNNQFLVLKIFIWLKKINY